jgi:uncharacterized membrane protein
MQLRRSTMAVVGPSQLAGDMTKNWDVVALVAALGCGVVGGVFFAFSAFIMSGLNRLPSREGIDAMKSINVTAVHPPLMLALFGSAALCIALIVRAVSLRGGREAILLATGSGLYLLGAVVLTIAYNVPLNDRLARLSSSSADAPAQWQTYVRDWTLANHIRSVSALAAMVLIVLALTGRDRASASSARGAGAWPTYSVGAGPVYSSMTPPNSITPPNSAHR